VTATDGEQKVEEATKLIKKQTIPDETKFKIETTTMDAPDLAAYTVPAAPQVIASVEASTPPKETTSGFDRYL
jgi:hypothetical protein